MNHEGLCPVGRVDHPDKYTPKAMTPPESRAEELAARFPLTADSHPYRGNDDERNTCREQRAATLRQVAAEMRRAVAPDNSTIIEKVCRVERLAAELEALANDT